MNIDNCFINNKYNINITDKYIHLINYKGIINLNNNSIEIDILNKKVIINGNDILIKKMDKYELIIVGNIEKVIINER